MEAKISPGLRITLLIHFFVGLIFGLIFLLFSELWGELVKWPVTEPTIYRLLGAAILGYGISSWLAYRETAWERVKVVVQMEIVWTGLGALVMLWGLRGGSSNWLVVRSPPRRLCGSLQRFLFPKVG